MRSCLVLSFKVQRVHRYCLTLSPFAKRKRMKCEIFIEYFVKQLKFKLLLTMSRKYGRTNE